VGEDQLGQPERIAVAVPRRLVIAAELPLAEMVQEMVEVTGVLPDRILDLGCVLDRDASVDVDEIGTASVLVIDVVVLRVVDLVIDLVVDVVVAGRPPADLHRAHIQAVSPNTLVVVGPPDAAQRFRPADATWLLREAGSGTRATSTALLDELEVSPPMMTLGSHGAVVAAAVAGLGVTLVSRQAVRRELDSGSLVELPVTGTPMDRPWHIVTQSTPTGSTELLINHLLAHRELGWQATSTGSN